MTTLAKTKWILVLDGVPSKDYSAQLAFGPSSAPPGCSGGQGTMVDQSGQTPFVWVEDGNEFMFQLQNQSPAYSTLTTYSGVQRVNAGNGWSSNFLVNFSKTAFSMTKVGN